MKTFALSAVIALAATSALAQATTDQHDDQDEYYVVLDPETKKCTILEQEPTDTPIIGVFKTPTDAEAAITTMEVCKSGLIED